MTHSSFLASLSEELGILHCHGADAEKFLQGQFSNDLTSLPSPGGQWSSYSTAKGRMIANFYLLRDEDGFWLLLSRDLTETVAQRLRKFRLMAKVDIEDAGTTHALLALWGVGAAEVLGNPGGEDALARPHTVSVRNSARVVRLPWPEPSFLILASGDDVASWGEQLRARGAHEATGADWRLGSIRAGIAFINAATTEQVIPQELNLEVLGGISFTKGCYPGQEIVARSHYLGRLKNQCYRLRAHAPLAPGRAIFSAAMGEQSIGLVIQAAAVGDGSFEALAVVRAEDAEHSTLGLEAHGQVPLEKLELPYSLPLQKAAEAN
ncbi:folate-binding protein [Acidithiobacillus caldus]|uniref:Folate-binding protein n=1 Tax=Acidithiobacillus caldus TaxID=33059 RepID=A0A1E7YVP5_9PROT|nr:folate-binding protein [Acidithiobacillus caldus]